MSMVKPLLSLSIAVGLTTIAMSSAFAQAETYQTRIPFKSAQVSVAPAEQVANASVWTPFTLPIAAYWRDIAYGNGVFVSTDASISGKFVYSSDGANWLAGTMPKAASWAATYGDGKFVAVGGGISAVSPDGKTWTQGGTMPSGYGWEHVAYGGGTYVAIAQTPYPYTRLGAAARSTDGVSWSKIALPLDLQYHGIAYGSGKFVATAAGDKALLSSDGLTWSQVTMPAAGIWISVTYGNGRFVAVNQGSANASAVSVDGVTWTRGTLPAQFSAGDVVYGNGKFVASGTSGKTLQSVDGLTWTENAMPSANVWYALGFGNGRFVTMGNNVVHGAYAQ